MLSTEKIIKEWVKMSQYDLKTAGAMLETGRYLYVTFMCQQSVEKILKAVYIYKKNELPPRTHNLAYLADVLEIALLDTEKRLLYQLNQFYLESRYPNERIQLAKAVSKRKGQMYLNQTQKVWKCLKQNLP